MPMYRVFEVAEKRILLRRLHYIEADNKEDAEQLAEGNWEDDWEPMGESEMTPSGFVIEETQAAPENIAQGYEYGEFSEEWWKAAQNFDSRMKQLDL